MKKCRFLNDLKTDRYDSTIDCFCIVRIVDKNTNCLVLYDNISKNELFKYSQDEFFNICSYIEKYADSHFLGCDFCQITKTVSISSLIKGIVNEFNLHEKKDIILGTKIALSYLKVYGDWENFNYSVELLSKAKFINDFRDAIQKICIKAGVNDLFRSQENKSKKEYIIKQAQRISKSDNIIYSHTIIQKLNNAFMKIGLTEDGYLLDEQFKVIKENIESLYHSEAQIQGSVVYNYEKDKWNKTFSGWTVEITENKPFDFSEDDLSHDSRFW